MKLSNKAAGFTLLELMMSLTILAVIVTLVFGGLRVSVKAWEKGEAAIDRQQRYRTVLTLIRRQLASIVEADDARKKALRFTGEAAFLQCVSTTSLVPEQIGNVRVLYRVVPGKGEGRRLLFFEQAVFSMTEEDKSSEPDAVPDDAFYELLSGFFSLEVNYLASVASEEGDTSVSDGLDGGLLWLPTWEAEKLPVAVRLRLRENEDSTPVDMVIPVRRRSDDE